MFVFKKKKFLHNERTEDLALETECLGLNILLEIVLLEENYEIAAIIKSRLDCIERESKNAN